MADNETRAILFAVDSQIDSITIEDSLAELALLAESAGADVVDQITQRRSSADPHTYLGEGKLLELAALIEETNADIAICDDELTPAQSAQLSEQLECRVIDRTQLILDIFAMRAHSREGKVQVELAQLRYLLPRLIGHGTQYSRLGGGIGTRGPGETKLETDRRHIRRRISELNQELTKIRQRRELHREARRDANIPVVALVGYTNAGKSTLLNQLAGADVLTENLLFATLDPTIRGVELPQGDTAFFVDTVGFIRKLPHALVAAFRATLEEVQQADILVHVADSSHPLMEEQLEAVIKVLGELDVHDKPIITVFNKADAPESSITEGLLVRFAPACAISALTGAGCDVLLQLVGETIPDRHVLRTYKVPYPEGHVVSWLHEQGRVVHETYLSDAIELQVELRTSVAQRVRQYISE
jgi:GTP-binding protein HflX